MPKTLLLADDSVTIQKVVGISFANEDIEITTVDNGRDAVAKARAIRPDVILADVVMPGMSGYEVCETVKADPTLRHIPVLLLTGTFEAFDQSRATAVGAAGHVAKPFEAQTLVDRVKQLLAAAAAPAAVSAPRASAPRPAAAPAAAPAAPAPASDDAFDFFSDGPQQSASAPPPVPSGDALDLDGPDGAFAFGDEDLASDIPEPRAVSMPPAGAATVRRAPDATIAMLPDPPSSARDDAFEFSFEGRDALAFEEPVDPDQLGHTTLLDPAAGSGFDVSSSDLSFSPGPSAATQILSIGDEGPQNLPLAAEDAELDLAEAEPFDAGEELTAERPFGASDPYAATIVPGSFTQRAQVSRSEPQANEGSWADERRSEAPRAPHGEEFDPFERDAFEDAPMVVGEPLHAEDDLDEQSPFEAAPAISAEPEAEPWDDAPAYEPPAAMPVPSAAAPAAAPALTRAELHDALEKIAWDAFAPITEKIVREAIAKVEQVAWEVVPKLAEALIQEEIRRLKGGSS